jgi:hypothetical protein
LNVAQQNWSRRANLLDAAGKEFDTPFSEYDFKVTSNVHWLTDIQPIPDSMDGVSTFIVIPKRRHLVR